MTTVSYGDDPAQFFELSRPPGLSKGVVVVIHGGFWRSKFDLSLGRPLASSLASAGWTAINLEYRTVGNGGGWPVTFDDVAAGLDALADVDGLDTSTVITLGHSAGGHLAVWAAGRAVLSNPAWNQPIVPVTAAVSQAGVLDFALAIEDNLGGGAVASLMGGLPDTDELKDRYRDADPLANIPLTVPVRCIHGRDDSNVPPTQSDSYVSAATAAGADATVTVVDGDHFVVIDPASPAWSRTLTVLDQL
ncbi:MAG: alpha/beta hydrolase [Aeromicrobium sp.]|uniref:alpha/beta hydrolase family protein n=1 Tax=Aeromicrobium sp. TaxID=1871063 RepID=UPI003C65F0CC